MKTAKVALTLIAAVVFALSSVGPLGADTDGTTDGASHTGKGTVLTVSLREGHILMTEESGGTHVLSLSPQTRVIDETGGSISAASLQPGDLVREECLLDRNGKGVAALIRRLRPAWQELASPE